MRAVAQRVKEASVRVDGREIARIGPGLLVYLGVGAKDTDDDLVYLAEKIAHLRVFADERGAMNRSVIEALGAALVVSQFTLYGDARRGRRPSFVEAMEPARAEAMYLAFAARLEALGVPTARGEFRAMMDVISVNDGPVTILFDSHKVF
ncbi:MAG: D-aminoacyl-tRNA deacylase [Deltaproteobacteria bacterium]|nr:D-aminoacyl-tRNA deacylase [Deltaproteobacteria bacterium]